MKTLNNIRTSLIATALSALVLGSAAVADDTEIFFGQSKDAFNTNPNILFVLDTSGSMGHKDGGTTSRMDRMKLAMRVLLQESSSFRVGLMGFSGGDHGGSIHYPVGDLEAQSTELCPETGCPDEVVIARPNNSDDDATQNDDTGVVTLNAGSLIMSAAEASTTEAATTEVVSEEFTGSAYATQIVAETSIGTESQPRNITSSSQWFYNGIDEHDDRYGYRFEGIDIPANAQVVSAYLTFTETSRPSQVGEASALIRMEFKANPEPLPTAANPTTPIATRLTTATNSVQWNQIHPDLSSTIIDDTATGRIPVSTLADNKAYSPDVSELMTLIVALPEWSAGNAMSFLLDPVDEYIPSFDDIREFHGLDAGKPLQPVLNYTYTLDADPDIQTKTFTATQHTDEITHQTSNIVFQNVTSPTARAMHTGTGFKPRDLGFLFENIDIPNDAEILSASLVLHGTDDETTEVTDITEWIPDEISSNAALSESDESPSGYSVATVNGGAGTPLGFNILAEATSIPLPYMDEVLNTRPTFITGVFEEWETVAILPGESVTSPNLADVIASAINPTTWSAGGDLSLKLEASTNYENVLTNSLLIDTSTGNTPPKLSITWKKNTDASSTLKNTQTTAIRFANVHVPPTAEIKSARLVFTADKASIGENTLEISAEYSATPDFFSDTDNDISKRTRTPEKLTWNVGPWDVPDQKYYSDDIKNIVQEVVNLPEWCGGNAINIMLEKLSGDDSHHAISSDTNLIAAPALEITYSPDSAPSGTYCSKATHVSSVNSGADDATEDLSNNSVSINTAKLQSINDATNSKQAIGLKFTSLLVPKDAIIVSAELSLTHEQDSPSANIYQIRASQESNPTNFDNASNTVNAISRKYTGISQRRMARTANVNDTFNANITNVIQERVNAANWEAGNPIVIKLNPEGNAKQSFYSYDADEARAPSLLVYYQSEKNSGGTEYRDNLINIVDRMFPVGGTPIVGSFFEATSYYTGKPIDYGLQRGDQGRFAKFYSVSHPLSYEGGEVSTPYGCSDSEPTSTACSLERIVPKDGDTPTYISPIESECQQNHIVILSDGRATSNSAENKIRSLTGNTSCIESGNRECGVELASWLSNTDQSPFLEGDQVINTHTIGFNLDHPEFLIDLAAAGGGKFYSADSAAELLNAFKNIFNNVSKTDTSFVAPTATVSQSNRLKNRDDIYFALFKPEATARWAGNLKRYKLAGTDDDTANILDVNDAQAVDERTGRFFTTAKSYWSDVVDGDSVELGGAAEKIQYDGTSHVERNVYTYAGKNGADTDLSNGFINDLLPENPNVEREWLRLATTLATDDEYVTNLLNWAHGQDVADIDGDGDTEEARGQMGDPMHSQPLMVNYAGGQSVVHVATNEGYLHAIDHATGRENFAFIPKELLKNLRANFENEPTSNRPYGLDGGMVTWIQDENNNGVVDLGTDKAYLYIGMRRGGNLYYALDITDPNRPKYMWSIAGGATVGIDGADTEARGDFVELGETWSKPVKSKIYKDGQEVDVLIFGAGYGSNQDPREDFTDEASFAATDTRQTREEDTVGRGFFIVDATTGARLWATEQADFPKLKYSVPSELRVIDINFDGLADQIYFGDMGGQVWRFDYNNDSNETVQIEDRITGGVVGTFADNTPESARRFYYPPDVALVSIGGSQQLSISIGSGWRAHPLDTDVEDRFYSFRMSQVYGAPRTEDGEIRYPSVSEASTGMIDLSEESNPVRITNAEERGWFLPLDTGEKVLSSSVTVDNSIVFTSYIPSSNTGTCAAAIGGGAVYFVDLATGNPIKNLDENSTGSSGGASFGSGDRSRRLPSAGIPPAPSVLFPELGKATLIVGRDKVDEVAIDNLKYKTFWQEHIEDNL